MSYKQNIVVSNGPVQLVDKSRFGNSVSQGGVTCTNNGDGSWTINGNVTAENRFNLNFYQLGANVIPYWLSYMVPVEHNYYTQDCGYDKLGGWLFYYLEEGKNYENFKIYPQIISLTDTFGSGNEPKNKEQVKAKFPDDLYPYNPTNRVTTYKELIKVSEVCQLLDKRKYSATQTINGVVFTNNGDGSYTLNGTCNGSMNYVVVPTIIPIIKNHIYLLVDNRSKKISDDANATVQIINNATTYYFQTINSQGLNAHTIVNATDSWMCFLRIRAEINLFYDNVTLKPQLFDLTEMFGSGNEPATIAEFKAKFPDELYPYSPNCWITSYKNVSKVGEVCQLLDKSKYPATNTTHGITFTNNGDGTITVNGETSDKRASYFMNTVPATEGHIYLLTGVAGSTSKFFLDSFFATSTSWLKDNICRGGQDGIIFPYVTGATIIRTQIAVEPNTTANNLVFKPQLYDLTEMYGEGKEPKTVEEFRAKFPNEMYDYNLCCTV